MTAKFLPLAALALLALFPSIVFSSELPDDFDHAILIAPGNVVDGNLQNSVVYFQFATVIGNTHEIRLSDLKGVGDNSTSCNLTFYSPHQTLMGVRQVLLGGPTVSHFIIVGETGDHYIVLQCTGPSQLDFQLSLSTPTVAPPTPTPTAIPTETPTPQHTPTPFTAPSPIPTSTPTSVPTPTPMPTNTPTSVPTATPSMTPTPTVNVYSCTTDADCVAAGQHVCVKGHCALLEPAPGTTPTNPYQNGHPCTTDFNCTSNNWGNTCIPPGYCAYAQQESRPCLPAFLLIFASLAFIMRPS